MDPRVKKLAQVLIHYSLKLKKGQLVKLQGEYCTMPLLTALFEQAVKVGAQPFTRILTPDHEEIFLKHATDAQLKYISPLARAEVSKLDAFVHVWGSENTRNLSGVDPKKQAAQRTHQKPIFEKYFKRMGDGSLSWVGTLFPTNAEAQEADMSLADWADFVYGAGRVTSGDPVKHWTKIRREQDRIVKILNKADRLHVRSANADLTMRVKGRKWINCAGEQNFPDGEVFTGPIEDTVEGFINFTYPAIYMGREVEDVRFEFKKGKVVSESAGKNLDYLRSMLDMDRGARFVGEFAIGTNYNIKRFSKNILFDEKIGGTCHLAVGRSIPESLGKNKSVLHWDMICDMKKDSEIQADGKVVYRNGKFTI